MKTLTITRRCMQLISPSSSAACTFLQLFPRRAYHTTPPPDFLFPATAISNSSYSSWQKTSSREQSKSRSQTQTQTKRAFTTSPGHQTIAIINPRKDEDGKDMHIEITARASNRLKQMMAKDSNPNLALRIDVTGGGCHGFQYLMKLQTLPPLSPDQAQFQESSTAVNTSGNSHAVLSGQTEEEMVALTEDDTVFMSDDGSGARVVINADSLELLKGSKVDYTTELIGSQWVVDNPAATSSCGCGTSFNL